MRNIRVKYMIGALSISALLATSGCANTVQPTFQEDAVIAVDVTKMQKAFITSSKVYSGVVKPSEEISIIPKISGRVSELALEVGMPVQKGQVLLKLEDKDLQNAVKKAVAAESAAEANIQSAEMSQQSGIVQAESGVVQVKGSLVQAENSVLQAKDNITKTENAVKQAKNAVKDSELALKKAQQQLDDATISYERQQQLYAGALIAKETVEKSESALVTAQANYDSAQTATNNVMISLATAQKNLESAQQTYTNAQKSYDTTAESFSKAQQQVDLSKNSAGIEASKEAWKQAQVAVDIAKDTLEDAVITSPISGIIAKKNTNVGQMVSAQSAALVVVNLETVRVLTYIPAADINTISQGDAVQVKLATFDDVTQGTVKTISPIDADGEGYPVEIEVSNPDLTLKSGMLVDLQFISNNEAEAMFIPSSAVIEKDGKSYVYVTNDEHPERKEIEIGAKQGSKVIVKKGLTEHDLIITNNLATLSSDVTITYE